MSTSENANTNNARVKTRSIFTRTRKKASRSPVRPHLENSKKSVNNNLAIDTLVFKDDGKASYTQSPRILGGKILQTLSSLARPAIAGNRIEILRLLLHDSPFQSLPLRTGTEVSGSFHRSDPRLSRRRMCQESEIRPLFLQRVQLFSLEAGMDYMPGSQSSKTLLDSKPANHLETALGCVHYRRRFHPSKRTQFV